MKTLLKIYFIPRSFLQDEFTLSSGGTNIRTILKNRIKIFILRTHVSKRHRQLNVIKVLKSGANASLARDLTDVFYNFN